MSNYELRLFEKMAKEGVVHREVTKNDLPSLHFLLKQGFATRLYKKGKVFYGLTEKSLHLLENHRQVLLSQALLLHQMHSKSQFYWALLEDLRFFDDKKSEAQDFKFLGDWQLHRPPDKYQLALAQERFFEGMS